MVGLHQTGQSPEIVTFHGNVDEDENAASRLLSHLSLEVRESKVVLVSFRLATLGLHFRHCCFCFFLLVFHVLPSASPKALHNPTSRRMRKNEEGELHEAKRYIKSTAGEDSNHARPWHNKEMELGCLGGTRNLKLN